MIHLSLGMQLLFHSFVGTMFFSFPSLCLTYHTLSSEEKRDEWKDIISGWDDWKNDEGNLWQVVSDGIPNCMRRKAWLLLTGAKQRMEREPDLFEVSLKEQEDRRNKDEK
jgi:hypothetical protein